MAVKAHLRAAFQAFYPEIHPCVHDLKRISAAWVRLFELYSITDIYFHWHDSSPFENCRRVRTPAAADRFS